MNNVQAFIITKDGEISSEIMAGDTVRITKEKSKEYLRDTIELNKSEPFIKIYTKTLFELSKCLTGTESQFINYLIQYIRYTSGILAHENGSILTRNYISNETGLALKTVDRILNSLIKKQILGKHKTGRNICLTVNPYVFMKGSRVNDTLVKMFQNTKWAKITEMNGAKHE